MCEITKLSYFHHIGKYPLRALTLGNVLEIAARTYENRNAIVSVEQNRRLTFRDLLNAADKFAAGLAALGMKKGDRLGLWAPNVVEWHVVNMACMRAGFILATMNPGNQAREMEYCINKVGIKILVCAQYGKRQNYYDILQRFIPELEKADSRNLNSSIVPSLKSVIVITDEELSGTLQYKHILELAEEKDVVKIRQIQHLIQPDDACYIQFSSGTTGQPKAALASHFQITNSSFNIGLRTELNLEYHRICVLVPFFHVCGTTVSLAAALHFGTTIVVGSSAYSAPANLRAIEGENCTSVYGTPTMYFDLIKAQIELQLNIRPKILLTGGAPCPPELLKQMRTVLRADKIQSIYGLTEVNASGFLSLPMEDPLLIESTVGHVSDHLEVKVVDEWNNIVPLGTSGELCLRGYPIMLGYWGDEKKTKETIGDDGWLKTGDQFILQENGYGRVTGRIKDVILRGGENIFPKEIEDIMNTIPGILEVQAVGLPHERLGEEVCAYVRVKEGTEMNLNVIRSFLKSKLSFSKIPSQVKIVQEFPKTATGKIKKYLLKNSIY